MALPKGKKKEFSNVDIVVAAVFKLDGLQRYVDTEDIAIIADQIAPGRFSWIKYKDQINLEHVRVRLFDASKEEKGGYLVGNKKDGWRLTAKGANYAERMVSLLGTVDLSRVTKTTEEKRVDQWLQRERGRMLGSEILDRYKRDGKDAVTVKEAQRFFKIDEYITGQSRIRKVDRLRKAFGSDPELKAAVMDLADKVLES